MSIGTKVRLSFDGTAVKRGLAGVSGQFKRLGSVIGRVMRQTAIGGARQAGASLFGLLFRGATAVPREVQSLALYAQELENIAGDTKTARGEIIAMHKALELVGMDTDLAGDAFREFATKMGEAIKEESEARKALHDLGFLASDFKGLSVIKQVQKFAQGVRDFTGDQQDLTYVMDRFLGGDLGLRMVAFFQNYNQLLGDSKDLTGDFAEGMEESVELFKEMNRVQAVGRLKFSEFALGAFQGVNAILDGLGIERGGLGKLMRDFDARGLGLTVGEKIGGFFKEIGAGGFIDRTIMNLKAKLVEVFRDLGKVFAEGVKETLGESFSIKNLLPGFGARQPDNGKSTAALESIEQNTEQSTNLLRRLARDGGAVYA